MCLQKRTGTRSFGSSLGYKHKIYIGEYFSVVIKCNDFKQILKASFDYGTGIYGVVHNHQKINIHITKIADNALYVEGGSFEHSEGKKLTQNKKQKNSIDAKNKPKKHYFQKYISSLQ